VHRYLLDNDIDQHISEIRQVYGEQRNCMVQTMQEQFPENMGFTRPERGMFIWVTLPEEMSSIDLFHRAIKEKVAFVPGQAFYADGGGRNTLLQLRHGGGSWRESRGWQGRLGKKCGHRGKPLVFCR